MPGISGYNTPLHY